MKVRDFIEFMKGQDQDAEVEVIVHRDCSDYRAQGGTVRVEAFQSDNPNHIEYSPIFEYGGKFYPSSIIIGGHNC